MAIVLSWGSLATSPEMCTCAGGATFREKCILLCIVLIGQDGPAVATSVPPQPASERATEKMCVSKFIVIVVSRARYLGGRFVLGFGVGLFGIQRACFSGNVVYVCSVVSLLAPRHAK